MTRHGDSLTEGLDFPEFVPVDSLLGQPRRGIAMRASALASAPKRRRIPA